MKKSNNFQKQLKFHCPTCKNIYQLLEIQPSNKNCADKCLKRWQEICHDYYKKKILAHLALQEEAQEKDLENSNNLLVDWLKKAN